MNHAPACPTPVHVQGIDRVHAATRPLSAQTARSALRPRRTTISGLTGSLTCRAGVRGWVDDRLRLRARVCSLWSRESEEEGVVVVEEENGTGGGIGEVGGVN